MTRRESVRVPSGKGKCVQRDEFRGFGSPDGLTGYAVVGGVEEMFEKWDE